MLRYKEDSAFNQSVYHKTLHDAKEKPKAGFNNGIVVSGLVTKFAFWVSGKGKKNKDFAKQLNADNNQRYVNVRYNKNIVESTTTLRGDSTTQFLERYPMTYEFARNATDLEIKYGYAIIIKNGWGSSSYLFNCKCDSAIQDLQM